MAPPYTNFLGGPVFWGQVSNASIFDKGAQRTLRTAVHHAAGVKALLARAIRRLGGCTGQAKGQTTAQWQKGCAAKRGTPLENLAPGHFPVREQRRGGVGIFFHHNPHSAPQTRQGNLSPPGQEGEIREGANPRAGEGRTESKGHRPRIGTQEYRTM